MNTYIAIDIGASSGRLIQSSIEANGRMVMEETHRFKNGFTKKGQYDCWDIDYLIEEILIGLEKVKKSGISKCYVGIDTWGVDYCLIDKTGKRISESISYRDPRTESAITKLAEKISLEKIYEKTGTQIQPFNTLFQLFVEEREKLERASQLLLIPDYLGYVFTGEAVTEKTNASTMQLLNANTKDWDEELLELVGVERELFPPLVDAGTILGKLQTDQFSEFDLPAATFICIASHDTASAVIGTPGEGEDWAYISSGTWSLLGIETTIANVKRNAFLENYTNEWGAHNTIRFLKNIMGMWLVQEAARMQEYQYSYAELATMASKAPAFQQFIDLNDDRFLNPDNMILEIQKYCEETKQAVPRTAGEIARCIYDNLSLCYACELEKLERLTGTNMKVKKLHIVGGGSNNQFLNQLTANVAGISVEAGPSEATAIGNIVMQMLAVQEIESIKNARKLIKKSFEFHYHEPETIDPKILTNYKKFIKEEEHDYHKAKV